LSRSPQPEANAPSAAVALTADIHLDDDGAESRPTKWLDLLMR
jgi:hypothetical protein